MDAIAYDPGTTDLRAAMDRVCDDRNPLVVAREPGRSVVLVSLEDYSALEETAYLLKTPANARRLLASIAELETGR